MADEPKITLGLALSGSGNRTTFYIGFLEVFAEQNIKIDYLAASSGGSMVAAAYACGTLSEFKEVILALNNEKLKQFIGPGRRGGLYSLDPMEEKMREFTKGKTFEEVRPLMSFVTVDIENGEQVNLCMGDIAHACRISCTLPGVFEPAKWGNRTLVDGGIVNLVPVDALKQFPVDVTIGVNMRGTRHIFSNKQMTLKKVYNFFKKVLFIDEMEALFNGAFEKKNLDFEISPPLFNVLGKSLDLAIRSSKQDGRADLSCDLMIDPGLPLLKRDIYTQFHPFYEMGRKCAEDNLPRIRELVRRKRESMLY
ncbi:MAG: patatin-like phospholipase family protein [Patescibacteria group bacterium]|nr:patatin-like phospholipase family protein [Patescibacteria group bacterium]